MTDTIYALSSGAPPAAIGVIRISGPGSRDALTVLARTVPTARRASVRALHDADGGHLDDALVLWLPGPGTATGEDCAELHCHGGRAVIAAVKRVLASLPGMREADAGEFTRRAFANGRIDLAQAEGLSDLLSAETDLQRLVAQNAVGGVLSRVVEGWRDRLLALSALIEAELDFSDEEDVSSLPESFHRDTDRLRGEIVEVLARPSAIRLRDGIRVVFAGPPNAGKSSLFNVIVGDNAAIVAPTAGTTRDVIERPVALAGIPFVLIDTAGLRDQDSDAIEAIGIEKARSQLARADIVLWLGPEGEGPDGAIEVQSRCDDPAAPRKANPRHVVSSISGEGLRDLESALVERARSLLPKATDPAINDRQAKLLTEAAGALAELSPDPLLTAEALRSARAAFDRLLGRSGVEDMLDSLFGTFCIGK